MNSISSYIDNSISIDYALIDLSRLRTIRIEDAIFQDVKLIDIFQKLNSNYLFFKINSVLFPYIFTIYQESSYDFQFVIPWIKMDFYDYSKIYFDYKFKGIIDYIVVFQKPFTKSIKSKLRNTIIEEDLITTLNHWEKELISELSCQGYEGIYVTSDGCVYKSNDIVKTTLDNSRIELF